MGKSLFRAWMIMYQCSKFFYIIFVTFLYLSFYDLRAELSIHQLVEEMDNDTLIATGLHKLTDQEKAQFDLWIRYKSPNYYISIPKTENAIALKSYFKTTKFKGNSEGKIKSKYDESEMAWDLGLVAVFQEEAPYLKEFIEFHKLMGVKHFYLYNNLSPDQYYPVLKDYIDSGEVELFEWPVTNFVYGQCSCYTDAVERSRGKVRWLIIADTDLFFFPVKNSNLIEFLRDYESSHIGGVVANMLYYGTSGIYKLPENGLMTELLSLRKSETMPLIRSIVKPHRVKVIDNPHYAKYQPGFYAVDENFKQLDGPGWQNLSRPIKKIRINHYMFRTQEFLYNVYGLRHLRFDCEHQNLPLPFELPEEIRINLDAEDAKYNQLIDTSIHRFLPKLKKKMFSHMKNSAKGA